MSIFKRGKKALMSRSDESCNIVLTADNITGHQGIRKCLTDFNFIDFCHNVLYMFVYSFPLRLQASKNSVLVHLLCRPNSPYESTP